MAYDSKQRFIHREMLDYLALNQEGLLLLMWLEEKEETHTRKHNLLAGEDATALSQDRGGEGICA